VVVLWVVVVVTGALVTISVCSPNSPKPFVGR